jgi:serine/threonine protein kinase/tetratricopeptide (TPR) repeat protein
MGNHIPTVKEVFDQAHEIETPVERQAYLDKACGGSSELRHKVESLLRAYEEAGSFLVKPAIAQPATGECLPEAGVSDRPTKVGPDTTDHQPSDTAEGDGPGTQIGPYKLVSRLGEGGMGTVYLAEQEKPIRRQVALKIIKSGMDSAHVIARFEAERQALTMMDHPNIAKVFDAGTTGVRSQESGVRSQGRPYFVMELVRGVPITRFCDQKQLTVRERLELFVLVCQALQHAHQKGVMHRDIKPSNVLVADQDGKPAPKVIDFGLAKATEQPLTEQPLATQIGSIMGTLEYMSPEQADFSARGVDTRTDVYALGVLLYELLTGTTPLESARLRAGGLIDAVMLINQEVPPTPSQRASSLGPQSAIATDRKTDPARLPRLLRGELDWIVMKALEKQRERRYQSAVDFARDVERYLADEPVEAGPPSARYRLVKFVRRNRVPVSLLSVAGVALMALVVILFVSNQKVNAALDKANTALDEKTRAQYLTDAVIQSVTHNRIRLPDKEKRTIVDAVRLYGQSLVDAKPGSGQEDQAAAAKSRLRAADINALIGERVDAVAGYDRAIRLYEKLAADSPDVPEYAIELARSYFNLGGILFELGKWPEAESANRQAAALHEKLAAKFPAQPQHRHDLADDLNDLGILLRERGEFKEAEQIYRRAVDLGEKLVSEYRLPDLQINLAARYHNLGNAVRDQERPADSLAFYQKAITLLDAILAKDRQYDDARVFLRNACWDRANALGQLGKHGEAIKDWQRAYDLDDGTDKENIKAFKLTAEMEEKINASGKSPTGVSAELRFETAQIYARAIAAAGKEPSLQKQYADRALALLQEIKDAGYFRAKERIERLKKPDFEPLRQDPRFQEFLKRLNGGA